MAQLPGEAPQAEATETTRSVYVEPDPGSVGSMLSRFYSGVHRAAAESDDEPPQPVPQAPEGPRSDR
jgi:hypothetical protein